MNKPTSTDVARLAGVSQTTVSMVLNHSDHGSIPPETREKVLQAAEALHYTPQIHRGRGRKAPARSRTLLVLIPTMMNEYYASLISMVEDYAQGLGYRLSVCNTFRKPELEKYYLETFAGNIACGIIYTFLPGHPQLVEQLSETIPTVIIGEKHSDMSICSIELSNISAGALLAEYLYRMGHRKFVFISTPIDRMTLARSQRLEGIRRQLCDLGVTDGLEVLTSDPQSETDIQEDGRPYEYATGRKLTAQLVRRGTDATALIGVNDMTAIGILNELTEQGLKVPRDFSVCGFDNIFSASITTPGLTTIDHHLRLRCEAAVDMILSRLEPGRQDGPGSGVSARGRDARSSESASGISEFVRKIEYTPQLVLRGSSGPAGRRK